LGTIGASLKNVTALATNDVWAAGYVYFTNGYQDLMEHWDGIAWSRVDVPRVGRADNPLYGLAPDRVGGLWAVGNFYPMI
jgi:hypothetical protein